MISRPPDLPDYEKPPVVEVALSARFKPLTQLQTVHVGMLWDRRFRDGFPVVEEHPPLPLTLEEFNGKAVPPVEIQFGPPPLSRQWFLNQDGSQLIQVQSDGFMHNWRQATPNHAYPRYEPVLERFHKYLDLFQAFLAEEALGDLVPIQCEVTYVNHIEAGEGWERPAEIRDVFPAWTGLYSDAFLPDPDDVRITVRFVIPSESGEPLGRLHITCQPALRLRDKKPILVLRLIARGKPEEASVEGIIRFLNRGRTWIVRGFTSFTSEKMHAIWRRRT